MPENWKTYKLDDISQIGSSKRIFRADYVEKGIPFYRSKEIIQKSFNENVSDPLFIDEQKYSEIKEKYGSPGNGDVLISSVGNRSGIPYLVNNDGDFYFKDGNLLWFRNFNEEVYSPYLFQWLKSNIGQNLLLSSMIGSAQKALTIEGVKNLNISLPLYQEQKSIASILSALDDKIELNLQMNKTLEEMAMALYKHWFVEFGPFQNGEFVDSELGEIPKGWTISNFDELLILQRGFDLPQKQRVEGNFPVFAASGRSTTHLINKVKGPGIVTGRSGVLGKVFLIQEDFWPLNTTLWVKKYLHSSPYHAYFLLKSMDLKEFNSGSAVPTLNRNDVHRQRMVKPPLEIIKNFDQNIKTYFDHKHSNYLENITLTEIRDTLLPKLISGEVRVKDVEKTLSEVL